MYIHVMIFSRDRAMQLDATLRSFYLHCRDAHLAQVSVLYLATTPRSKEQYSRLQEEHPAMRFIPQADFRKDVLELLNPSPGGTQRHRFGQIIDLPVMVRFRERSLLQRAWRRLFNSILFPLLLRLASVPSDDLFIFFMVDDNIFVQDFDLFPITNSLRQTSDALGFSLRLGRNTTYTYMHNSPQALPEFSVMEQRILRYNWTKAEHDFNYPLEVSSSIYRATQIFPLLTVSQFQNPNMLEYALAIQSRRYAKRFPQLLCFGTSVAFCNPINIVQNVAYENRAALTHHYAIEELAERFDQGQRIDVKSYSGFCPNSCHQEVELRFTS